MSSRAAQQCNEPDEVLANEPWPSQVIAVLDGRIVMAAGSGFFERLRSFFSPPRLEDPDFGTLLQMFPNKPQTYWEAEWLFPPVGYRISIALDGDGRGPAEEARAFYLSRVAEFEAIIREARPQLERVANEWLGRSLAENLWDDVKLAGFDIEDGKATPVKWNVAFETTGKRWLGITVPMIGSSAQEALVDT